MYTKTERQKAVDLYIKYYKGASDVIREPGSRCGEALALTWDDIDWEGRTVTVERQERNLERYEDMYTVYMDGDELREGRDLPIPTVALIARAGGRQVLQHVAFQVQGEENQD